LKGGADIRTFFDSAGCADSMSRFGESTQVAQLRLTTLGDLTDATLLLMLND
jgi:hypothetical protein